MLIGNDNYCLGCMKMLPLGQTKCSCGFDEESYHSENYWLPPGTILKESYLVGRVLGEGGFGITYVGMDIDLRLKIAIKEFYMTGCVSRNSEVSNEISTSIGNKKELFEKNREKFINEARTLAKFSEDKGIVTVHRFFNANNTAYIIMEFLEGDTLKTYLSKNGMMKPEKIMDFFVPVMDALAKVHNQGLIHRDISPDNIMVCRDGQVRLLDFGAARETSDGDKSLSVVLKHGYAPMEQYRTHGKQGPWTDVYALAATIYVALTGQVPESSVDRVMDDILQPPCQIAEGCSQAFSDVIMKAMSVKIEDRYQSVAELKEALLATLKAPSEQPVKPVIVTDDNRTVYAEEVELPEAIQESAGSSTVVVDDDVTATFVSEAIMEPEKTLTPEPVSTLVSERILAPVSEPVSAPVSTPTPGSVPDTPVTPETSSAKKSGFDKKKAAIGGIAAALGLGIVGALASGGKDDTVEPAAYEQTASAETETTESEEEPVTRSTVVEEEPVEEEPVVAEEEPVYITISRSSIGTPDTEHVEKVQNAINEYIADKINVQIKLADSSSRVYKDVVRSAIDDKTTNLIWTAYWENPVDTYSLYNAYEVYDITDLLPGTTLYNAMSEDIWQASEFDGKNYYIPILCEYSAEGYELKVNKSVLAANGYDVNDLETWSDVTTYLDDVVASGDVEYPYWADKTSMFPYFYFGMYDFVAGMEADFIAIDRDTDAVVNVAQTDRYNTYCKMAERWYDDGILTDAELSEDVDDDTVLESGKWGMICDSMYPSYDHPDDVSGTKVVTSPVSGIWLSSDSVLESCYCITESSTEEEAKACIDFLGLLYTDPKLADLYTYGIEGEDFVYDSYGRADLLYDDYFFLMFTSAPVLSLSPTTEAPTDWAKKVKDYVDVAWTSESLGFRIDLHEVRDEYDACKEVWKAWGAYLELGYHGNYEMDEAIGYYQDELENAGIQTVIDNVQSQYDEWKRLYK